MRISSFSIEAESTTRETAPQADQQSAKQQAA
jgi:hypothetical protein